MSRLFDRPIAHRGLHDASRGIIENSPAAFAAAIAAGYAIECDIQLSSDGIPFVFHDDTFERLTPASGRSDALPIKAVQQLVLNGSAAGEVPPTFAQFLAQVAGRAQLQLELKQQSSPAKTKALAESVAMELKSYDGPATLESFDPALLIALRRAGVTRPLGIVTYGYNVPEWDQHLTPSQRAGLRYLLHWPATRFDFISCRVNDLDLAAVRLFRRLGLPVTSWTITSSEMAAAALKSADQIVFEGYLPASA